MALFVLLLGVWAVVAVIVVAACVQAGRADRETERGVRSVEPVGTALSPFARPVL